MSREPVPVGGVGRGIPGWPDGGPTGSEELPDVGVGSIPPVWQRALARAVDSLIVLAVAMTIVTLTAQRQPDDTYTLPGWAGVAIVVVWYLYETVPVWLWGQTPGKRLLGLVVVDRRTGRPPGINRAALRIIVVIAVTFVAAALLRLGPAAVVVTYGSAVAGGPLKRNWPDRAADTVVVRSR